VENKKEPYVLISLYQSLYKEKYNRTPQINKFREKWAMQDVIDSVGFDRAKELLKYYFSLPKGGHPLPFFLYNFDRMDAVEVEAQKDKAKRRLLLEETKKMVENGGIE
jgi:hypothetical protein